MLLVSLIYFNLSSLFSSSLLSICSFFFFKQKTAYELRISDWSSDVCSSDLRSTQQQAQVTGEREMGAIPVPVQRHGTEMIGKRRQCSALRVPHHLCEATTPVTLDDVHGVCLPGTIGQVACNQIGHRQPVIRSEERRVGKECVSTCRSRWWPSTSKKKT